MLVKGKKGSYKITIGLEVHAQLKTNAKLFSLALNAYGKEPNSCVDFFDASIPGTLPIINRKAIELAVKTGIAIDGEINKESRFDRKHYFYPDLPSGYQITQQYRPIVKNGSVTIECEDEKEKKIRVNRIHIEQDAAKSLHDVYEGKSCVDLNRAGVPLIEIVTEPDLSSPVEVVGYLKNLRGILRAVDASDADMEKGSFRCDVNLSISEEGSDTLGPRVELKNINSYKFISKAIDYEINRQINEVESGNAIVEHTRLYDATTNKTVFMREKETEHDYGYITDADMSPIYIDDSFIEEAKSSIPELPAAKIERFVSQYGMNKKESYRIAYEKQVCSAFEEIEKEFGHKCAYTWVVVELLGKLAKFDIGLKNFNMSVLKEIIHLVSSNKVSHKNGKEALSYCIKEDIIPKEAIEKYNLATVEIDENQIKGIIKEVVEQNPKTVEKYNQGKHQVVGFFIGKVLEQTKGAGSPEKIRAMILEFLSNN